MNKEQMIEEIYKEIWAGIMYTTPTHLIEVKMLLIWDCLDWLNENNLSYVEYPISCWCCDPWWEDNEQWILEKWEKLRLPIEQQNEECITYIYNLLWKT